ncbi:hypothetical protein ACIBHY_29640 [Nonomuraea sp. NPDC050547]|uniref:hypothetical protein n=1 Tax=Nonomuraea sp. NPDC050547 TaxID=3364368 RepID=UPI0037BDC94C
MSADELLVVSPEKVAVRAGLKLPLTEEQRETVAEAIGDAFGDVAAYLGRPPLPVTLVQRGAQGNGRGGWQLAHDPVIEVLSTAAETGVNGELTGLYTITYRAGLNPAENPVYGKALGRYISASAAAHPMVRRVVQSDAPDARLIKQANVEGQGVTWEDVSGGAAGSGAAGAPPSLDSLKRWRRRGVNQQPGIAPHPLEITWRWPWP